MISPARAAIVVSSGEWIGHVSNHFSRGTSVAIESAVEECVEFIAYVSCYPIGLQLITQAQRRRQKCHHRQWLRHHTVNDKSPAHMAASASTDCGNTGTTHKIAIHPDAIGTAAGAHIREGNENAWAILFKASPADNTGKTHAYL